MSQTEIFNGQQARDAMCLVIDEFVNGSEHGQMYIGKRDDWTMELNLQRYLSPVQLKSIVNDNSCGHELVLVEIGIGTENLKQAWFYTKIGQMILIKT